MLSQRKAAVEVGTTASTGAVRYTVKSEDLRIMESMLEPVCYRFLVQSSAQPAGPDGVIVQDGAVLEWSLLWNIYLNLMGGGDRWLAYSAFADGLTVRGRRHDLWAPITGELLCSALQGVALTPDIVISTLEFSPSGVERLIMDFRRVLGSFTPDELSMFLRFATGIGRLPASRGFPNGQKLKIRFMPDGTAEAQDRLPSAHTCFWVVDMPCYDSFMDMASKLRQAIAAPQPFALS
jgi:hypothetical protein